MSTPRFDNTYATLPDRFYSRTRPAPVSSPESIRVNEALARELGFDPEWLRSEEGAAFAVGNHILPDSEPIAMAYAGHQFGHFNPQLGDGRANLLGEVITSEGERRDLHLKGSGRTPWSRGGDGRSPLGPVLREYLVSEAMHAMGVPTTRALAATATGETVVREGPLPGAVLVRVARSHIRIGTMEYFSARRDQEALEALVAYTLERHPAEAEDPDEPAAITLLRAVVERQAELVARWMNLGFIHGVMNTDNMLLSGETIDYGPCAFMEAYDPQKVFSSIDRFGRYAYRNQPLIAQWNLAMLARALLPLVDEAEVDTVQGIIDSYPRRYARAFSLGIGRKLGWAEFGEGDAELVDGLLKLMQETGSDHTLTFRRLTERLTEPSPERSVAHIFELPEAFGPWLERWQNRLEREETPLETRVEAMRQANPAIIPRNHQVERAITQGNAGDLTHFHALADALRSPFEMSPELEPFAHPAEPEERVCVTFCGT